MEQKQTLSSVCMDKLRAKIAQREMTPLLVRQNFFFKPKLIEHASFDRVLQS
jgi:hypothetical protein